MLPSTILLSHRYVLPGQSNVTSTFLSLFKLRSAIHSQPPPHSWSFRPTCFHATQYQSLIIVDMSSLKSNSIKCRRLSWQLGLDCKNIHVPQLSIMGSSILWSCNQSVIIKRLVNITSIGRRQYLLRIFMIIWLLQIYIYIIKLFLISIFLRGNFFVDHTYNVNTQNCLNAHEWVAYLLWQGSLVEGGKFKPMLDRFYSIWVWILV